MLASVQHNSHPPVLLEAAGRNCWDTSKGDAVPLWRESQRAARTRTAAPLFTGPHTHRAPAHTQSARTQTTCPAPVRGRAGIRGHSGALQDDEKGPPHPAPPPATVVAC